jgi:Mn2+/Fe2+ NRAMP family transporter
LPDLIYMPTSEAVPVMAAMMIIAGSERLMGRYRSGLWLSISGWGATGLMALAAAVLIWSMV